MASSSTSSTIRKAIGVMKDQTSISIAKVAGNLAPDLEVLVVKATSHEEIPADDKYVREILNFTSFSKGYVNASLICISKRLAKTRDWIVAVKSLMLVHRLLVDGHPSFEDEIVHATRGGMRVLNMGDFRDEAHSNSWDHAGFVRVYAMYLDEKVEFLVYQKKLKGDGINVVESGDVKKNEVTPVREMRDERVLDRLKHLLQIIDRVLGCKPSGVAKNNRLVLVAVYQIVRDSFKVYVEICDVLGVLMDRFMEMEYAHCVKAFEFYVSASKMMDELAGFYGWCKDMGIARSSEYPEVQKITDNLLGTLEGFLKGMSDRTKSPEKKLDVKVITLKEQEPEPEPGYNEVKALPAPERNNITPRPQPPPVAPEPKEVPRVQQETSELVNLRDDGVSADEQGNKLALALFSGVSNVRTEGSWEEFSSSEVTSAWQTPAAELGKADWELALVETSSNLSKQKADLGGGFDSLVLNGMYDQGAVRQHVNTTQVSSGSASSVALPGTGKNATPILALPAPDGTMQAVGTQDPFAASLSVPPPSYVQIAEMERKQHLLVQEQQLWQQYGRDGMQGQVGLTRVGQQPMMTYGMPQFGGIGQHGGYYNAPF
jgi:hypothetical protein